jgi:hypothetical protein
MVEILELTQTDRRKTGANIGLAIWRLKCFYETFVQDSTFVLRLNFCTKNPPHRKARKSLPVMLRRPCKEQQSEKLRPLTNERIISILYHRTFY